VQYESDISLLRKQLEGWPLFDESVTNNLDPHAPQCHATNVPTGDTGLCSHFESIMMKNANKPIEATLVSAPDLPVGIERMKKIVTILAAVMLAGCASAGDTAETNGLAIGLAQLDRNAEETKGKINASLFMAFFRAHRCPPSDPKLRASWYAHTTRYLNLIDPILFNRREQDGKVMFQKREREIGTGKLGLPFESAIKIEGIREERGKVGTRTLAVGKINGKPPEQPTRIWIENIQRPGLPKGKPCILKGFETGQWIGGNPHQQAGWQFQHKFFVTEVVEPEDVKLEESQQP
jgi:hypothetical protein